MAVLCHLKHLKADIVILQETHLTTADFSHIRKFWVGQVLGSPAIKGKAGVLLLILKQIPCEVLSLQTDK